MDIPVGIELSRLEAESLITIIKKWDDEGFNYPPGFDGQMLDGLKERLVLLVRMQRHPAQ